MFILNKILFIVFIFGILIQNTFGFDYILGVENKEKILGNNDKVLDLDVLDNDEDLIKNLKKKNKFLIGYINAGAIENYREDYKKIPKSVVGKTYPGWEDERFLDVKNYKKFAKFFQKYLDIAKEKGFDAIEFDNIDTYDNFSETGFKISKQDELKYLNFLEKETHKRGLKIFQKNAPELSKNLVEKFDGAIVEGGFYNKNINNFLVYIDNKKPVYNIEYTDNTSKDFFLKNICPKSQKLGIISILKNRNLDEFVVKCVDKDKKIIEKYSTKLYNYSIKKRINLEVLIDKIIQIKNRKKLNKRVEKILDGIIKNLKQKACNYYPIHKNIIASVFWVGEGADASNAYISNVSSAWDEEWLKHSETENKFYYALPYNDFDENGNRKLNAKKIPWYKLKKWKNNESIVKNRWVKIISNGKISFAQWEDVGPLLEDDFDYVFGNKSPKNTFGLKAGIDLSPDLADSLGIDGSGIVSWQFVPDYCVSKGDFSKTKTYSNINWK